MTKIAACLLAISLLTACETTTNTAKRETLEERAARVASNQSSLNQPAPPAEGPEDVPPGRAKDPMENPALVPTPLLRDQAIGGL